MNIKPPIRPQKTIDRLIDVLEPHATPVNAIARKRLTWEYKGKTQLFIFKKGELSIIRNSDRLLMVTVYEPHLFGVAEMLQPSRSPAAATACEPRYHANCYGSTMTWLRRFFVSITCGKR
ncbi:Crp/Fnr family transcriptional regulator [Klebsiella pneumoniae]|nr:Crp/Fnr family transcriptional regulator [Klebsiella pneumoniae]